MRFDLYLTRCDQPYLDDPTNQTPAFTRNRIRLELLPLLEQQYNPRVREALIRLGELAGETNVAMAALVDQRMEAIAFESDRRVHIDTKPLLTESPHLLRMLGIRIWQTQGWPQGDMTRDHWQRLATAMHAGAGRVLRRFRVARRNPR